MRHLTLILALGLTTGVFGLRSLQFEERLEGVENETHLDQCQIEMLHARLAEAQADVARSNLLLASLQRKNDEALEVGVSLATKNASFQDELRLARNTIEAHADKLSAFESSFATTQSEDWKAPLEDLRASLDEKWSELGEGAQLAQENRNLLENMDARLVRDVDAMWSELMGPTVQLSGESTVGSGVLLESQLREDGDGYQTYLLTAWHVVRDILADADELDRPVPVTMYSREGEKKHFEAELLRFDPDIDSALLILATSEAVPSGAKLATREKLEAIKIFSNIYAAGCPLGNDPIPTFGEIADTRHVVDGDRYWMVSAPTYVGNSGGGIFDAESFELIGIFSKIYTHGNLRPTVVPHMGLATPLSVIYDWLDGVGYAQLVPSEPRAVAAAATSLGSLGSR